MPELRDFCTDPSDICVQWFLASIFGTISGAGAHDDAGQVTSSDLLPVLQSLFSTARSQIIQLGALAVGSGSGYGNDSYTRKCHAEDTSLSSEELLGT